MIYFDHFEVHVRDSFKYVIFLKKLFAHGRYKKISENDTYMFLTHDNIRIEIKQHKTFANNFELNDGIGFCLPCLRMKDAKNHLTKIDEIHITKELLNPDGSVFFFKDHEGIDWHIKDYEILDIFTNI